MTRGWLPSLPQVTSELLAVLAGTIGAAIIISRVPALRRLVADNSIQLVTSAESQDPPAV